MTYFTPKQELFLIPDKKTLKDLDNLDNFLLLLEESGVGKIINETWNNSSTGRNGYDGNKMFAVIAYAFAKHSGSLRKIEESLTYDIRFMYLMDNEIPTYVTLSKFLNNVVVKHQKEIYSKIIQTFIKKYEISIEDIFIDGTKFEANANKYKFVWKPTTFHKNLNNNVIALLKKYYEVREKKGWYTSKEIAEYVSMFSKQLEEKGIKSTEIKTGKGIRNSDEVKDYILLKKYLIKAL